MEQERSSGGNSSNNLDRLSFFFKVCRVFGVVSFSGINESRKKLVASKHFQAVGLFVQVVAFYFYFQHSVDNYKTFINSFRDPSATPEVVTFGIFCIYKLFDLLNVLQIIVNSRKNCKLANKILAQLQKADEQINYANFSRATVFKSFAFLFYAFAKIFLLLYFFDYDDVLHRSMIRLISAIIMSMERFYCIFCYEISSRFSHINAKLRMMRNKNAEKKLIRDLSGGFETLIDITNLLKNQHR